MLDKNKQSPLLFAAQCGYCECVDILLKEGADVNAADNQECSALYYAAATGHNDCVNRLPGSRS